ncbi:MAG: 30S ribosomal protein S6 [Caldiserica bacterium]|nr:30S ribosomal protein S6 [Caldisericota bacterium]
MRQYETCFILRSSLSPEETEKVMEKIQSLITESGGEILKRDSWGKRRLAYTIEKEKEGQYFFLQFKENPAALMEFKRQLKLMPEVLRFMVLKLEDGGKSAE